MRSIIRYRAGGRVGVVGSEIILLSLLSAAAMVRCCVEVSYVLELCGVRGEW